MFRKSNSESSVSESKPKFKEKKITP